jgi:hypothetical protein
MLAAIGQGRERAYKRSEAISINHHGGTASTSHGGNGRRRRRHRPSMDYGNTEACG